MITENTCDCGKPAQWHGSRNGLREFSCLECWSIGKQLCLIARNAAGHEMARQWVPDIATANKLMVARNRPLPGCNSFHVWGIETEEEQPL